MPEETTNRGGGDCVRWSRADLALARRAARERWGVPDALRTEALYQAAKVLADVETSHRDKLAAMKLLLEADRQDLAEDKFSHDTRPPEQPADDYIIDLSDDEAAGDPPQPGDGAPA